MSLSRLSQMGMSWPYLRRTAAGARARSLEAENLLASTGSGLAWMTLALALLSTRFMPGMALAVLSTSYTAVHVHLDISCCVIRDVSCHLPLHVCRAMAIWLHRTLGNEQHTVAD